MAIIKVSDLPTKDTLDDDDRVLTWSEAGGTQMTLGQTFAGYLKTLGGVMTGAISRNGVLAHGSSNSSQLILTGGTTGTAGAGLWLNGGEASEDGLFRLRAEKGGVLKDLVGQGDGSLTWDGNDVLTAAGGTMTGALSFGSVGYGFRYDSSGGEVGHRYDNNTGSLLALRSASYEGNLGGFELYARNASASKMLIGKADGFLAWDGKAVERVNSTGGEYIRFESGLQICWGSAGSDGTNKTWHAFPVAFKNAPKISTQITGTGGNGTFTMRISDQGGTGFNCQAYSGSDGHATGGIGAEYVAVGKWK